MNTDGHDPQDKTIVLVGNSMRPTLRALDVVTISSKIQKIRPGDIIVFPSPKNNQKVVHRVISIVPQGMVTRGDNNLCSNANQFLLVRWFNM
jgi:signal peptidase I